MLTGSELGAKGYTKGDGKDFTNTGAAPPPPPSLHDVAMSCVPQTPSVAEWEAMEAAKKRAQMTAPVV